MNYLEHLKNNKEVFFNFMKKRYPLFEQSNIFFRDMQYAIMSYFELKEAPIRYEDAEKLAKDFIESLEHKNELIKLDHKTWKVNFELEKEKQLVETNDAGVENE